MIKQSTTNDDSNNRHESKKMSLVEKLKKTFIVETEDQVYYDAEGGLDKSAPDSFIANILAQLTDKEKRLFQSMQYSDAKSFIKYLKEEPDEIPLAQIIVAAAYCTFYGIKIDDDTRECAEEQLYYFNDDRDLHYEYETDIDLG